MVETPQLPNAGFASSIHPNNSLEFASIAAQTAEKIGEYLL